METSTAAMVDQGNATDCGPYWVEIRRKCYLFVLHQGRRAWNASNEFCRERGAHLPFIVKPWQDTFLVEVLKKRITVNNRISNVYSSVWVGGTDADIEGKWVWRDAQNHHMDTPITGYTNWNKGKPDTDHNNDRDCLFLSGQSGFDWRDAKCDRKMHFICEKRHKNTG